MQSRISCPYCGQENDIVIDESGGANQRYIEDCQVCCQHWQVIVTIDSEGEIGVEVCGLGR